MLWGLIASRSSFPSSAVRPDTFGSAPKSVLARAAYCVFSSSGVPDIPKTVMVASVHAAYLARSASTALGSRPLAALYTSVTSSNRRTTSGWPSLSNRSHMPHEPPFFL